MALFEFVVRNGKGPGEALITPERPYYTEEKLHMSAAGVTTQCLVF